MLDTHTTRILVVVTAAAASGALITAYLLPALRKRKNEDWSKVPKKWIRVGEVSKINIYPVKSCKGMEVDDAVSTKIGLKGSNYMRDRIFSVVTSKGSIRSQRQLPRMSLIGVSINEDQLTLNGPHVSEITITIPEYREDLVRTCRLVNEPEIISLDCGHEVGTWLSDFLEVPGLRLYLHQGEVTQRKMTDRQIKFPMFTPSDKGTYQDISSYMLMSEESLENLNENLEIPLSYHNFRPSILIKGIPEPFAEDLWSFVRIGGEGGPIFKAAMPCIRCKLTTVDIEKGEFNETGEPLKTLYKLQRSSGDERVDTLSRNTAVLGLQLGLLDAGNEKFRVGDPVYAALL